MKKEIIIEAVRREIRACNIDLGRPTEFVGLLDVASEALRNADTDPVSPARLQSLTAMGLLGPKTGLPDDGQCETLEDLVESYCEESDHESLLDLVAAFGCGWQRDPGILDAGWEGLWDASFTFLVKRVHGICRSVYRSLTERLHVQFPADDNPEHLLQQTATYLVTNLIQPVAPVATGSLFTISAGGADGDPIFAGLSVTTDAGWEEDIPTGARAVYQCTDGKAKDESVEVSFATGDIIRMVSSETVSNIQIWSENAQTKKHEKKPIAGGKFEFSGGAALAVHACTCGRNDCGQTHHLSAWDPGDEFGKLQHFLFNAIRGRMQSIKANDYAQSLLGSYWARHGWGTGARLRLAPVIHHVCQNDTCQTANPDEGARVYMGDSCDRCNGAANVDTPIVARERLIVVDTEFPLWEFSEFWRCGEKECCVPGLNTDERTLIVPTHVRLKNAICSVCRGPYWSENQKAVLGAALADSPTRLQAVRESNAAQGKACSSCNGNGVGIVCCDQCQTAGRAGKLPPRPTWCFASTDHFDSSHAGSSAAEEPR